VIGHLNILADLEEIVKPLNELFQRKYLRIKDILSEGPHFSQEMMGLILRNF